MKSRVYYIPVDDNDDIKAVAEKLSRLLDKSALFNFINKENSAVCKLHFGEEGNKGFVKPLYLKVICDDMAARGAKPFLSDTNTLYKGRRTNSKDHHALAMEHGFTKQVTGVDVIIPDDKVPENVISVPINKRFVKDAKILAAFIKADVITGVAHFKGHMMTGFGGALKNIGMGCASRVGKLAQHSDIAPLVYEDVCTGCGACVNVCPVNAISLVNNISKIDGPKCIGCATCIAACPSAAIEVDWGKGGGTIQEKMTEYAYAVLKDKKEKSAFINFAIKITKECDCLAKDDPRIVSDVGIFAALDPVSVDRACFDMVNKKCGKDIFRFYHPKRNGIKQLKHAEELGLGSQEYELIKIP